MIGVTARNSAEISFVEVKILCELLRIGLADETSVAFSLLRRNEFDGHLSLDRRGFLRQSLGGPCGLSLVTTKKWPL